MTFLTPEMVERALSTFNDVINSPIMEPCSQCSGVGYHGFGSDQPDWCNHCGGNQYNIRPGEELRAMRAALTAALGEGVTVQALKFVQWAMQEAPWNGCDLDGGTLQDKAEALGLIVKVPYDLETHGPSEEWYVLHPDIIAMLAASPAPAE